MDNPTRAAAEQALTAALADVELNERARRFVAWTERSDADALLGLADLITCVRAAARS